MKKLLLLASVFSCVALSAYAAPGAIGKQVGTTSTTVVPATNASTPASRTQAQVYNNSSSGNLWCRDDNSPAIPGVGVEILPNTGWVWQAPNVSPYAINCISDNGTLSVGGVYYQ